MKKKWKFKIFVKRCNRVFGYQTTIKPTRKLIKLEKKLIKS